MEWGIKENRIAIIALFKVGKKNTEIFDILKSLKINKRFVERTAKRYKECGLWEDRPRSGKPRTARTPNTVKAVQARIQRNPLRKQKIMALEMNVSARSMSRMLKQDLKLGAYRRSTGHLLNDRLKEIRRLRAKKLLSRYGQKKYQKILFTDEKIFTVEESYNKQNDKVYARSSKEASAIIGKVQRGHHPASVMVWWGVSYEGVTKLHFCPKGVKTSAKVYQEDVLNSLVKPLNESLFKDLHWVFQQDSAPAHKARTTQEWLKNSLPEFIAAEDWPFGSPDLNPLD